MVHRKHKDVRIVRKFFDRLWYRICLGTGFPQLAEKKVYLAAYFERANVWLYRYLKLAKRRLWDYSDKPTNFMGIVCLEFSLYWFALALAYYIILEGYF